MDIDHAHVDETLATTRAVRRRLDLERPVDNQLLLDCIDLAEQAPTGGNLGSRRWIIVRDQAVKDQLGHLYQDAALGFMSQTAERLRGTGHPQEKVMASATFLAEHLADVPAIVVPTIIGRHDGSGRPGLFDSVIQAAWSFCLALRARGLGTTWMTAVFEHEAKVKEILDIPDHMTEIVMLPVAWTKGTDFNRAPRHPARSITYFDRFGVTSETGPGPELRFDEGPAVLAEIDIDASPRAVWQQVTDVEVPTRFSDEALGAEWQGDERGVGAVFIGRSRYRSIGEWSLPCHVDVSDEPRSFGWRTSDPDNPGARWRFDLEQIPSGTRLRYHYVIGPGASGTSVAIEANPDKHARIVRRRLDEMKANMQLTVASIKELAESPTAAPDDAVMYSPVVFTPQRGKAIVAMYLEAAKATFAAIGFDADDGPSFRYVKHVVSGDTAVLEFETEMGGKYVNGVDLIRLDDSGKIVEFRVMVRPLQALNAVHALMGAQLATLDHKSPAAP